jgi:hypothetical protein
MKRERKSRNSNKELYAELDAQYKLDDSRYYGIFMLGPKGAKTVYVDPKRYAKMLHVTDNMKKVMSKHFGPYFKPARKKETDWNCNFVGSEMFNIRVFDWEQNAKPMIDHALEAIKGYDYNADPMADDRAQAGILAPDEISMYAMINTMKSEQAARAKRNDLFFVLHAQVFHQIVSRIEGITIKLLTRNKWGKTKFDRNELYNFKGNCIFRFI